MDTDGTWSPKSNRADYRISVGSGYKTLGAVVDESGYTLKRVLNDEILGDILASSCIVQRCFQSVRAPDLKKQQSNLCGGCEPYSL